MNFGTMLVVTVNRLGRVFRLAYSGLVVGYSAAMLLGTSVWLEMRFTVALLIPLCSLMALIAALKLDGSNRWLWILPQLMAVISFFGVYGIDPGAMLVIPAVLLREGFGLGLLSLSQANLLLVFVVLVGNSLWLRKWR